MRTTSMCKKYCHIQTISFVIICLLLLPIICVSCYFYYAKHWAFVTISRHHQLEFLLIYIIKMESNDKFRWIDIKNRTCYYFDDIIKIEDFNFDNILIDYKTYEKIFVFVLIENSDWFKSLRIRFDIVK